MRRTRPRTTHSPLSACISTRYILTPLSPHEASPIRPGPTTKRPPVDEPRDSAIEMCDEQRLPPKKPFRSDPTPTLGFFPVLVPNNKVAVEEIDELLDELCKMPVKANRPPTPPPRSRARSAATSHRLSVSDASRASGSISDHNGSSNLQASKHPQSPRHRQDWSCALSQVSNISDMSHGG